MSLARFLKENGALAKCYNKNIEDVNSMSEPNSTYAIISHYQRLFTLFTKGVLNLTYKRRFFRTMFYPMLWKDYNDNILYEGTEYYRLLCKAMNCGNILKNADLMEQIYERFITSTFGSILTIIPIENLDLIQHDSMTALDIEDELIKKCVMSERKIKSLI